MLSTADLTGGLGNLLIHIGKPEATSDILDAIDEGKNLLDSERHYLGLTCNDVCAELCRQWALPQDLIITIQASGKPREEDASRLSACTLYIARFLNHTHYDDASDPETILSGFSLICQNKIFRLKHNKF